MLQLSHLIVNDMFRRTNCMIAKFSKADPFVRHKLFKCYCVSLYGCQLWDLTLPELEHVCVAWRKCVRKVMCLPYRTHNALLPFICDDISIIEQIHSQFISFITSLLSTGNHCLQTVTKLAFRGSNSAMCKSLNYICWKHGINKHDFNCKHKCICNYVMSNSEHTRVGFAIREFLEFRYNLYCHAEDFANASVIIDCLCTE